MGDLTVGSLCTGYGGLDLAVGAVLNAHTVWLSEFDKHAAQVADVSLRMHPPRQDRQPVWLLTVSEAA